MDAWLLIPLAFVASGFVLGFGFGWIGHNAYINWYWPRKIRKMQKENAPC